MQSKIGTLILLLLSFLTSYSQDLRIPKIEYEYEVKECHCEAAHFAAYGTASILPCVNNLDIQVLNQLGAQGYELIETESGFGPVTTSLQDSSPISRYSTRYIFRRAKPINEQQFYAQLDKIAQNKVDIAIAEIKKFLIATLNQSTRELFSTEYGEALKETILKKIESEMESKMRELIEESKQK